MKRFVVASILALGLSVPAEGAEPAKPTTAAVLAEFDHMAALPLWPGFDAKRIPLAIYDGERTILVRHPSPPADFKQEGGLWVYTGQHPAMRANTSTDVGGVSTATLLLEPQRDRDARRWASVLVHETFHVFQRERHPAWAGNEAELFTYPLDAGRLAARRLESDAFRRALAAKDLKDVVCWSGKALELRRERYASLPAGSVAYERGTELNEGLAAFIESLALGDTDGPDLPAGEYPAEGVRSRAYAIGSAQAALLDRLDPGWRKALEEGQGASLDELLAKALAGKPGSTCAFSPGESAAAGARAREDVARLSQEKQQLRETLLGRPGWKIEFLTGAQPLWPQGFDPLNVTSLGKGDILHRRWVKLGNDGGTVEILDRESLSEGAGEHPLFNGVRRLTITGLPEEPGIQREGDALVINGAGVTVKLKGATAEKEGLVLRVKLP